MKLYSARLDMESLTENNVLENSVLANTDRDSFLDHVIKVLQENKNDINRSTSHDGKIKWLFSVTADFDGLDPEFTFYAPELDVDFSMVIPEEKLEFVLFFVFAGLANSLCSQLNEIIENFEEEEDS